MPGMPRKKSETGIYHIIVRGINQQDIFHDDDDFRKIVNYRNNAVVLGYIMIPERDIRMAVEISSQAWFG